MFSGIIEHMGQVRSMDDRSGACRLEIALPAPVATSIGASVAVNGVCLTVSAADDATLAFDVVPETLRCTTLGRLEPGEPVNLEWSLRAGAPIDGHFVQGHVEGVGKVTSVDVDGDDYRLCVRTPDSLKPFMVPKGSVAIDGVSLTLAAVADQEIVVALIPTTLTRTTLGRRGVGDGVNLETDVLVRTVAHLVRRTERQPDVDLDTLREAGFL